MLFVTDPWFYAVALPAVFLTGLSKSGFGSMLGSLATPLLALAIPVPQAAAIMLPLLLVADAFGLQQLWRERDAALVRLFVPAGLAGISVGWLVFGLLTPKAVAGLLGGLTLAFLAQRLLFPPGPQGPRAPRWVGVLCALLSGVTSFVAHVGGPPINAYVLPLRLPPPVLAGTLAVFFACINVAKIVPYSLLGLIDARNLATSALLMPVTALGVRAGVLLLRRISPAWFYRIAYGGMAVLGTKLLWDGLR